MKKLFSMLIPAVLLINLLSLSVSAEAVFSGEDIETKNNRIFTVTVSGDADETLCAARFDFAYDGDAVEFRDAGAVDGDSAVKYYEEEGCLHLIFLNEKGVDLSGGRQLFTVDFKAEGLTETEVIDFTVSDCVNVDVESFDCTGGSVKVTLPERDGEASSAPESESGGASFENTDSSASSASARARTYSRAEESSEAEGAEEAKEKENSPAGGEITVSNVAQSEAQGGSDFAGIGKSMDTSSVFAAGAVITAVFIAVFGIAYHIGRKGKSDSAKPPDK